MKISRERKILAKTFLSRSSQWLLKQSKWSTLVCLCLHKMCRTRPESPKCLYTSWYHWLTRINSKLWLSCFLWRENFSQSSDMFTVQSRKWRTDEGTLLYKYESNTKHWRGKKLHFAKNWWNFGVFCSVTSLGLWNKWTMIALSTQVCFQWNR